MHKLDIQNKHDQLVVEAFSRHYPRLMANIVKTSKMQPLHRLYVGEIRRRYPNLWCELQQETKAQLRKWENVMENRINYLGGIL